MTNCTLCKYNSQDGYYCGLDLTVTPLHTPFHRDRIDDCSQYIPNPDHWWLDIAIPYEELLPMSNLIRAVTTITSYPGNGMLTNYIVRNVHNMGLSLRGRPLEEWGVAIRNLNTRLYREGALVSDSRLWCCWDDYNHLH